MVTDADAVMSIAQDHGMLAALAPGAIWVQMSTIGVAGIERVAASSVQASVPISRFSTRRCREAKIRPSKAS